jgi:site-specific DNA recombinase
MTMKFAFYGRVSTEDQQDPTSSKQWQMARAEAIVPNGAKVVREYFDVGQSRSLPWKRRPEASRLLADLKDPKRGWSAVVIGEPARAFYGGQFGLTFPLFVHHDVELWVPEVGGKVDPGSEAHELVMALYGGMSKGERNRIKMRVRTAMEQQAKHGVYLGGRPPFGYRLADAGVHPNPGKAARGQRLRRLERDPVTAPVLVRIFTEYAAGEGIGAIAEGLNRDGVPSPSAHDPARNRHRASAQGAWAKSAIRAILANPRYLGFEVWAKARHEEELFDLDDVAAGYRSTMKHNDRSEWVFSTEVVHEPLITTELWEAADAQRRLNHQRRASVRSSTKRTYALATFVHCGALHADGSVCGRRMTGSWNHGQAFYRCHYPVEYRGATGKHPQTVYLKEAAVTGPLDEWLLEHFDPKNLERTIAALAAAQVPDDDAVARAEAARATLADCDKRLGHLRKQIEGGNAPGPVLTWIREVEDERLAAERAPAQITPTAQPLTEAEVRALVRSQRRVIRSLARATPEQRATIYREMGLRITYDPTESDRVMVEVDACTGLRVGGGT